MTRTPATAVAALIALAGAAAPAALAGDLIEVHRDPVGDARLRRTDSLGDGLILPAQTLPDLVELRLMNWETDSPTSDGFDGEAVDADDAHLFRIDAVFVGLVNPPGPLGFGPDSYDPLAFGPSPLYGAIELDVDRDSDSGGELPGVAATRFLANAARFGGRPYGSIAQRAATSVEHLDTDWTTHPQFERSGADFALVFCGCAPPASVVQDIGDGDGAFEPGETWTVTGHYFERAGGYAPTSLMLGPGGGVGEYRPQVRLRFSHCAAANRTTVSLVYALDMTGAARLAGLEADPPINAQIGIDGNEGSLLEALRDLVVAAARPQTGLSRELVRRWHERNPLESLDATAWEVTALFGTAYAAPDDGLYAWSDVGFRFQTGDVNGDGLLNVADRNQILASIEARDGGPTDADGEDNGSVGIPDFPFGFSVFDLNYDGRISGADAGQAEPPCRPDWNGSGAVEVTDIFAFLSSWFASQGDYNASGTTDVTDIFAFLASWFAGCA